MMIKRYIFHFFILFGCALIAACTQAPTAPPPATPVAKKPVIMEPFRFHKLVEVSPGQDFDIVSWGRGSATNGSFSILHSDSSGKKFTTTTGDLDGEIVDVYNSDMDLDGNPEILIQAKANDTIPYAIVYAFEFNNNNAHKLDFPKLTSSQRKGYRGGDNFYIKEGKLMREFPVYDGSGAEAKPNGQKRQLEYALRNNNLTAKQLSKDSTDVSKVKTSERPRATVVKDPVKTTPKEKPSSSKKSKKHKEKKHTKKTHKKKRRHRRSSN